MKRGSIGCRTNISSSVGNHTMITAICFFIAFLVGVITWSAWEELRTTTLPILAALFFLSYVVNLLLCGMTIENSELLSRVYLGGCSCVLSIIAIFLAISDIIEIFKRLLSKQFSFSGNREKLLISSFTVSVTFAIITASIAMWV